MAIVGAVRELTCGDEGGLLGLVPGVSRPGRQ